MSQKKICLASDNWTPAHPLVIKAITEANEGYAPSYGSDAWTEEARSLIQKVFKSKCCNCFLKCDIYLRSISHFLKMTCGIPLLQGPIKKRKKSPLSLNLLLVSL